MKVFMNLAHRKAMAITELETIRHGAGRGQTLPAAAS